MYRGYVPVVSRRPSAQFCRCRCKLTRCLVIPRVIRSVFVYPQAAEWGCARARAERMGPIPSDRTWSGAISPASRPNPCDSVTFQGKVEDFLLNIRSCACLPCCCFQLAPAAAKQKRSTIGAGITHDSPVNTPFFVLRSEQFSTKQSKKSAPISAVRSRRNVLGGISRIRSRKYAGANVFPQSTHLWCFVLGVALA